MRSLREVDHQRGNGTTQRADDRSGQNEYERAVAKRLTKSNAEEICDGNRPSQCSGPALEGDVRHQGKTTLRDEQTDAKTLMSVHWGRTLQQCRTEFRGVFAVVVETVRVNVTKAGKDR